jgi:Kef-type K+ transport system membrane component KefB
MTFNDPFLEVAVVLTVAAVLGAIALWLRQPLIISFIVAGTLLGPAGFDWVHAHDQVDLFAKLGIGLLLFVVGLKLDPRLIRAVGYVALIAGAGQMILTALLGYGAAVMLGLAPLAAAYVAAALMFSSTVIIVKLLSDKREIETLQGRITLGVLIMQDVVVILLLIAAASAASQTSGEYFGQQLIQVLAKGVGFLGLIAFLTRFALPSLLRALSRHPELLTLFAIAWAIGLASLGVGLGFSKEVGAFVAGVSLAATPYKAVLAARLVSLRDFLLLFFFVDLGVQIDIAHLRESMVPALVLSAIVLFGKPLMVAALVDRCGYSRRTSILTGLNLGQISEFSLILAALGFSIGHIDQGIVGLITLVGLISIGFSTYMIQYSIWIYDQLATFQFLQRKTSRAFVKQDRASQEADSPVDTIIFGLGRYGRNLAQELNRRGRTVLGIDHDLERIKFWQGQGLETLFGDLDDAQLLHGLPLEKTEWVISTIPDLERGMALLPTLQEVGYRGRTALAADTIRHRDTYLTKGADVVLLLYRDAAAEAADTLDEFDRRCASASP